MTVNIKMLLGQLAYLFLFFALPLFLAAGTIAWPAGWIFLVLFFSFVAALTFWLLRHNPGLLKERMTMFRPDQKAWDKAGFALTYVVFLVWLVLMPLDAVRSTGPYHYVRHPMYAAALLFLLGTALLLGSWYGLLLGLILVGMIAGRAVLEERTLQEELQGYDSYMAQVKYRLIPHIW